MAFWEDDTSSRTPSLHQVMKWYRSRTVNCKLHHRATSRAESGEESCGARPASSSHVSGRSAADVSAASVHRARRPPPSKERCKKLLGRRSATRTVASGAMEGATDKRTPESPHRGVLASSARRSDCSEFFVESVPADYNAHNYVHPRYGTRRKYARAGHWSSSRGVRSRTDARGGSRHRPRRKDRLPGISPGVI